MTQSRRELLRIAALGVGLRLTTGVGAAELVLTPRQSQGPFYPHDVPLDADNDLILVAGRSEPAAGEICNVFGTVLDQDGEPVVQAVVEIWQCNAYGRYHHPWDRSSAPLDPNFQGYGMTRTDGQGRYRFRTIKPVPYPGRTPHIHFAVNPENARRLVTQMYVEGEPGNARDGLLNRISPHMREQLIRPFDPDPHNPGSYLSRFDIVVSAT